MTSHRNQIRIRNRSQSSRSEICWSVYSLVRPLRRTPTPPGEKMLHEVLMVLVIVVGVAEIAIPVSHWWRSRVRARLVKDLFPLSEQRRLIIICPSQSSAADSPNVATTHEDGLALAALLGKCVEHGIAHSVKLHTQVTDDDKAQDLFLICGPGGNTVTKQLFGTPSVGMAFHFVESSRGWNIVGNDEQPVHPTVDGRDRDYAILARVRNPWARPSHPTFVYLAAGIYGLGTWGATYYMANDAPSLAAHLRTGVGNFGSETRFAAVVEVCRQGVSSPIVRLQKAVEQ